MILKGQTASNDNELSGMWSASDLTGGACEAEAASKYAKTMCKAMLKEILSTLENAYLDRISTTQEDIGGNTWMMFGDILHVNEDVIGEMEAKL